jgi:hypothetical protein
VERDVRSTEKGPASTIVSMVYHLTAAGKLLEVDKNGMDNEPGFPTIMTKPTSVVCAIIH